MQTYRNPFLNVFTTLRKQNLKIKLTKCNFLLNSISFLGYKVSRDGISSDPAKLTTEAMKQPTNISETNLLDLFNYFKSYERIRGDIEIG